MEFKIEKAYKADFLTLLKSTCKKFKADFSVEFSDEQVIGTRPNVNLWGVKTGGAVDVIGYIAIVDVPELARMSDTGYAYLGCIKDDGFLSVHPTKYAKEKGFHLASLEEETRSFPCAECGRKIYRKIIHVFESPEGKVEVYGSGCAKIKFGINFTATMDKFFKAISLMDDYYYNSDECFNGLSFGDHSYHAASFAMICMYNIMTSGFKSGNQAREGGGVSTNDMTTADMRLISNHLNSSPEKMQLVEATKKFAGNTKFKWEEFVAWLPEFEKTLSSDDFGFNATQVCNQMENNLISDRMTGFGCYIIFRYWLDVLSPKEPNDEWNEDYSSLNVGDKIKDLGPITVKITNLFVRDTAWGTTRIYTFRGTDTNIKYKWFSTSKVLDTDKTYEIFSGSIKLFEDDAKYGKAVVLTRCKVKEIA